MGHLKDWAKRIKINIDSTKIDADLTYYPVPLILGGSVGQGSDDVTSVFDEVGANSKKIAVTKADGITQLYVEIELWDEVTEKAVLWVSKSDLILSSATNTILYLYYDSSQQDNSSYIGDTGETPAKNVWDSNFKGVWHMAQDPSGGSGAIKNSTSNSINGTSSGSMTSGDLVDGLIGKAIDFDGSNDFIYTPSANDALNITTTLTLECLFNPNSTLDSSLSDAVGLVGRQHHPSDDGDTWALLINDSGKLHLGTLGGNIQSTTASWAGLTWHYVAGTYNSSGLTGDLFKNGTKETLSINSYDTMAGATRSVVFASQDPDKSQWLAGKEGEIRVSNIIRPDAYFKATNSALRDDLLTWGIEEVSYLEDVSLDLAAYYRKLEDFGTLLRAHDGVELHDLRAELKAFNLSEEDLLAWLAAYFESTTDIRANLETLATHYNNLGSLLDAKGQNIESLMSFFKTAKAKYKDLASFLAVTNGSVLKDLVSFLAATDGSVLRDFGMYLKAISSVPTFRSITAQRVSSVMHEVS